VSEAVQILEELRRQQVKPRGICADSRQVKPGDVFAAMPGVRSDGRAFIADAVARGASAVLWESADAGAFDVGVPNLPVAGLQAISGELADLIYGRPSEKLWLCGVTGTNGKTSVSQWIAQASTLLGRKCGVIGTLGNGFPGALADSANTTPDAISIQTTLAAMLEDGAQACAMEVSSIGLDQGRTNGLSFATAVFTNLTRDHLEYHGSMEKYGAAKARLFAAAGLKSVVINLDDAFGIELCASLAGKGLRRIGYTLAASAQQQEIADEIITAEKLRIDGNGLRFTLRTAQGAADIAAPLHGRFNASNLLAVLGALLASGVAPEQAAAVMPQLVAPPGRMQTVASGAAGQQGAEPLVVVDYAHTPDALEQALTTLREVAAARGGRLLCLFGCGGERDPGKRPLMGEVVQRLADVAFVSSDNPRSEEPQVIIAAILVGMKQGARVEADRATAIRQVVREASDKDVLLIAGKGHEPYQEIAGRRLPFSDIKEARLALLERRKTA
jgi:UDP-N-acetylmuramoyl-L-alanyl-D-glutamate--2,6-diaminopimelate ligase